jgi:uncharacterized protein YegL
MGVNEANNRITKAIFDTQCGTVLHRKGFLYTFVCSYGEALDELQRTENGNCPYTQLWLFSSDGTGDLPEEARDLNKSKIVPALKAITEFWENGGGLLLFCDNDPYNFEANYLLQMISFRDGGKHRKTKVRMGGDYRGNGRINVASSNQPTQGKFSPRTDLPVPGRATHRVSLRPGLVSIYEGDTISYATDASGAPLTNPDELWPFTAFAWSTDDVTPPRPFILFYDPVILPNVQKSPGPIVLHGGFTSAFYEFGNDQHGTGRLIVSIACWLVRAEERHVNTLSESTPFVTWTPRLCGKYDIKGEFKEWRPPSIIRRHSILILDGSGSMNRAYDTLITAANDYIQIQTKAGGLISVVTFGSKAKVLFQTDTRLLKPREGFDNGGTDFVAALNTAIPLIEYTPSDYECRIIFFTDGRPNAFPTEQISQIQSRKVRLDPIGCGEAEMTTLNRLACCGGEVVKVDNMEEVKKAFVRKAATFQRRSQ